MISWQYKKQTIVANSTTEEEYVATANCCGQVLWIQNQMLDYGFNFMNTKIYIDNESTICIVKNPKFHAKTKHIEIRHLFIRYSYEKRLIQVIKVHSDHNVADLLTKAFDVGDEAVHKELGDRMERAATTTSSLESKQDSGVNTLGNGEDSMKLMELMEHYTKLSELVYHLDVMRGSMTLNDIDGSLFNSLSMNVRDFGIQLKLTKSGIMVLEVRLEDPSKQGRKIAQIDEDEGITLVQMSAQTQGRHEHDFKESDFEFITPEEDYTVEPDISTTNVLVSIAGAKVSTASPEVKIAAENLVYIRRKKLNIVPRRQKLQLSKKDLERENLPPTELNKEGTSAHESTELNKGLTVGNILSIIWDSHTLQQLKKLSFDEVKELFETTMKKVNTFTPIKSDDTVLKVVVGSSKIDVEQELNQESSKRQKIGEGSEPAEESKDELSQEQLQQLMIIVLEEGMNVEALQTKYPIIDWEVYTDDSECIGKIIQSWYSHRGALVEPTPVAVEADADSLAIEGNLVLLWIIFFA
ncbi:hypothetical protein Tco_0916085 [Tanacetum coccineum]